MMDPKRNKSESMQDKTSCRVKIRYLWFKNEVWLTRLISRLNMNMNTEGYLLWTCFLSCVITIEYISIRCVVCLELCWSRYQKNISKKWSVFHSIMKTKGQAKIEHSGCGNTTSQIRRKTNKTRSILCKRNKSDINISPNIYRQPPTSPVPGYLADAVKSIYRLSTTF